MPSIGYDSHAKKWINLKNSIADIKAELFAKTALTLANEFAWGIINGARWKFFPGEKQDFFSLVFKG
jgi:hypothetical protein